MDKEYSQNDIRKGFKNLAKIQNENKNLILQLKDLKDRIAGYEAKEVGTAMTSMGYTEKEAFTVISMLKRLIPSELSHSSLPLT